jgi:hypothetical protein
VEDVGVDEVEVGVMGQAGAEEGDQVRVGFDGDDVGGAGGEPFGERAGAGTDLQDQVLRGQFGRIDDAIEVGFVQQKVLPQALAWGQAGRA